MLFWIFIAALVALVAAPLVATLRRGRERGLSAAASDLAVYRDQLRDVDRDLSRGVLAPDEAEAVRTEIKRRMLDADRRLREGRGTAANRVFWPGAVLVAAVPAFAAAVYLAIGAPGYPDLPLQDRLAAAEERRASRPRQAEAERAASALALPAEVAPEFAQLMDRLRAAVAERPDDVEGLSLLARNEARIGNLAAARDAQERLVQAKGEDATPADLAALLDITVAAAGGVVTAEAEDVLNRLEAESPGNGLAAYYRGLLELSVGRADLAFPVWRRLWEESPEGAPWLEVLRVELPRVAAEAGVAYDMPPRRGPDAAAIAAASEMSPEDREDMIRGMVDGLAARLAEDGGPPADWARLISALGVLGETDRARAIADEAETVFADMPGALDAIRAARERAGL